MGCEGLHTERPRDGFKLRAVQRAKEPELPGASEGEALPSGISARNQLDRVTEFAFGSFQEQRRWPCRQVRPRNTRISARTCSADMFATALMRRCAAHPADRTPNLLILLSLAAVPSAAPWRSTSSTATSFAIIGFLSSKPVRWFSRNMHKTCLTSASSHQDPLRSIQAFRERRFGDCHGGPTYRADFLA